MLNLSRFTVKTGREQRQLSRITPQASQPKPPRRQVKEDNSTVCGGGPICALDSETRARVRRLRFRSGSTYAFRTMEKVYHVSHRRNVNGDGRGGALATPHKSHHSACVHAVSEREEMRARRYHDTCPPSLSARGTRAHENPEKENARTSTHVHHQRNFCNKSSCKHCAPIALRVLAYRTSRQKQSSGEVPPKKREVIVRAPNTHACLCDKYVFFVWCGCLS